ncbi:MAG: DUF4112 domain-containing protein [Bacteroidaceae bacterium]|nr:DUF4112 domain-containing protein [Bacteroidaceae bacterium]
MRKDVKDLKSYKLIETIAKVMDNYYVDPLLGLVPTVGDAVSSLLTLPYLYFSIFKLKSIPLTLALLCNMLIDFAMGVIPFWIGDILDFFNHSYIKNYKLIMGYVEGDKEMIKRVDRRAWWMAAMIVVLCLIIWLLIKFAVWAWQWLANLF